MSEQFLLKTKLNPHPHSAHLVVRKRLLDRLSSTPEACLILVSAPAGYGKTTAMHEICEHWAENGRRAAWLSLDVGDNDPARFAAYLMAALNRALPEIFPNDGWPAHSLESTIIHVVNCLVEAGCPSALVLDDYHLITAQAVHYALNLLLENLPPDFFLLIGSRGDPPLQISRLRVRQRLIDLRAADLRFTPEEVNAFCEASLGITPSRQSTRLLEKSTEGWAAGLQLVSALIAHHHPSPDDQAIATFARRLSGSEHAIFEYLAEEVLSQQAPDMQRFLMATSILSRFNAELCNALMGDGNGAGWLPALDRANLFVTRIDEDGEWFRYHHLFASFLQTRLIQTAPERASALHKAAAGWLACQGDFAEAMEHALAASDYALAADLFTEHAWEPLKARGELMTLARWARAFPVEELERHSRLALFCSQVFREIGESQRAADLLSMAEQQLEEADQDNAQTRRDRGILVAYRSLEAINSGHPYLALELSEQAARLVSGDDWWMQIQIARTIGFIDYNQGDMSAAVDALQTAMRLSREISHHYWLLESAHWLSLTYTKMGNLRTAAALCSDLEAAYPRDFAPLAWVLAPHAIVATEWNELGQAESLFTRSIEMARREQLMDALWISCVGLARVHIFRREMEPVARLLDEGLQAAQAVGNKVVRSIAGTVLARQALARGDLNRARAWADDYLAERFNEYPAELEDLTLTRVWVALGEDSRALDLLDQIIKHARLGERNARLIEALILRTALLERAGQPEPADATLSEALSLGEPQGYLRTFIDHVPLIEMPLRRVEAQGYAYVRRILSAGEGMATLAESLTQREMEVLNLLAHGATNQAIAKTLVIGIGTVKSHINHIMSKLNAHNRTEAVALAREHKLIN